MDQNFLRCGIRWEKTTLLGIKVCSCEVSASYFISEISRMVSMCKDSILTTALSSHLEENGIYL